MTWGLWLVEVHGRAVGAWLESYDPDLTETQARAIVARGFTGPDGGLVTVTADPARAKRFGSAAEALREWRRVSRRVPRRADGRPNRPLSAFTVVPARLGERGPM